jgi:hypothetical protein
MNLCTDASLVLRRLFNYRVPRKLQKSKSVHSLTFIPYIIRRIRNDQHYALIYTTLLFYVLTPTCFGSSLTSSGSFLGPSELREIQIEWVV